MYNVLPIYPHKLQFYTTFCYVIGPLYHHSSHNVVLFLLGRITRTAAERKTTIFLHGPVVKSRQARILGATIDYTRIA